MRWRPEKTRRRESSGIEYVEESSWSKEERVVVGGSVRGIAG